VCVCIACPPFSLPLPPPNERQNPHTLSHLGDGRAGGVSTPPRPENVSR
jgi:hypothetical protein